MIRKATAADIPALIALGRVMHAESPNYRDMSFSAERLARTLGLAIDAGFAEVVELADGAVIGGMAALLMPHWFSDDAVSSDIALFIDPPYRGGMAAPRLLNAYARWARANGAKKILFGITTGVDADTIQSMCERLGWRRCGVVMEIT